jgi:hypothetical protein
MIQPLADSNAFDGEALSGENRGEPQRSLRRRRR